MRAAAGITHTLEHVRAQLQQEGRTELAEQVGRAIADLQVADRQATDTPAARRPVGGVMTTGEAAERLGVRSVNTVKRWIQEGHLQGFRRGGRILVSAQSVERMLRSSAVVQQQAWEQGLDAALAPFDASDAAVPAANLTWQGCKPWETDGTSRPADARP